jgi:hypothetical protein
MKNSLKGRLTESYDIKDPNYSDAHIIVAGNRDSEDIIDEIIREGLAVDRQIILDIIARFNRKAAELVVSGYHVTTGLVTMNPEIKGQIYKEEWNPDINKIDVSFNHGTDLLEEINVTKVEIIDKEIVNNKLTDMNQTNQSADSADVSHNSSSAPKDRYLNINNDVPACGIAFRRWLCKA